MSLALVQWLRWTFTHYSLKMKTPQSLNGRKWKKIIWNEEVCQRIDIIDGKFKGAQSCKVEKNRTWDEITSIINELSRPIQFFISLFIHQYYKRILQNL